MHQQVDKERDLEIVPLKSAVLCVDCECVSSSRSDKCPVCGSSSTLNLLRTMGGTLWVQKAKPSEEHATMVNFDLEITISLSQMQAEDLNGAVEGIARLIGPYLGRSRASFHIDVEPVASQDRGVVRAA